MSEDKIVAKIVLEVNLGDKPDTPLIPDDYSIGLDYGEYEEMTSEDVLKHCLGVLLEQSAWDEDTEDHCVHVIGCLSNKEFNILHYGEHLWGVK